MNRENKVLGAYPQGAGACNTAAMPQGYMRGEAGFDQRQLGEQLTKRSPLDEAHNILKADAEHRSLAADQVLMLNMVQPFFAQSIGQLSEGLFRWFKHQGFWPKEWNSGRSAWATSSAQMASDNPEYVRLKKAEKIALITSELSEMLEAVRKNDPHNEAEELADTLVRILDYAGGFGIPLAQAFHVKMIANYGRPYRHNKEF